GSETQHEPAPGEVVEQNSSVSHPQRVVVRQGNHTGAQPDPLGLTGRPRAEHLRRGDDLGSGRMVLAYPRLVITQLVEQLDLPQITPQDSRRVEALPSMERRHEHPETHPLHLSPPISLDAIRRHRHRARLQIRYLTTIITDLPPVDGLDAGPQRSRRWATDSSP